MAVSTVAKNFRDGSIRLADGAALTFDVTFEDGDFKIDGLQQSLVDIAAYEDRGEFGTLRKTKRKYPTFSFSCVLTDVSDNTDKNLLDAVMKTGAFAAGVSTTSTKGDVWTLDLRLTVEGTDFGDGSDHAILLTDCAMTASAAEGDPDKISISGTCYGTVTMT